MNCNISKYFLFLISIFSTVLMGQEESDLEFFLIDSYVTPEKPHTFNLVFFTSMEVKTEVIIADNYRIKISEDYLEDHSAKIDFSQYQFSDKNVSYQLVAEDRDGIKYFSEMYELTLPYEKFIETKKGSEPISTILFGMFLYLIPSPNLVVIENNSYFGLTKELPIITFYSSGYNYPSANISFEYSHFYNAPISDILRLGYKQIYTLDAIEYVSPGISIFTNFNGFNGAAAEFSIGLFKVYGVFTVYARYRYNVKPNNFNKDFHEISVGLYSHFFTIDF